MQKFKLFHACPECGETIGAVPNLIGGTSKWFGMCVNPGCNTVVNIGFEPTNYQLDFIADSNSLLGYFGGYGAGKTSSGGFKVFMHALEVANGETIIGAETWDQMFKTNIKELQEIIPLPMVIPKTLKMSKTASGGTFQLQLRNGHVIYARVFTNEGKLRSLNITGFWIEEASEVKYAIYNQLVTRQRHEAGKTYVYDETGAIVMEQFADNTGALRERPKEGKPKYLGILTSNPDPGWIRARFLFGCYPENVHYYGDDPEIEKSLYSNRAEKDPFISTYIVPTTANYHLPQDFIPKNTANKTKGWIDRYIKGSFGFAEGMVYPSFAEHSVQPFEIPDNWKHMISADFGRRDATAYLLGAIDPDNDILYVYKEYYMPQGDTSEWIKGFRDIYDPVNPTSWLFPPIGDPAGQSRGQADAKSWFDLYAEHGIYFIPSKTGKSSELGIAAGIALVNEYMEAGRLKYFDTLDWFKEEISNYKYQTASLMAEEDLAVSEKPVGGKDHLMDTLRGMISMLPRNANQGALDQSASFYVPRSMIEETFNTEDYHNPSSKAFWSKNALAHQDEEQYYNQDDFGIDYSDDFEGDPYAF